MSNAIEMRGIVKRFGGFVALDGVSLDIADNAFFALLGPSGCGKTTLLRTLAGFEAPQEGRILLGGQEITHLSPRRRPLNMMFQSYALFPHMSVEGNIAYGLEMARLPRAEIRARVAELLEVAQLSGLAGRRPDQLSGGQRQRVALARALARRPRVLLLDEPLSALDKKLRQEMQLELKRLQAEVGITFLVVTHDQDEALVMADRIAVLNAGRVAQVGAPRDVYENPASRFVAGFVGVMNFLPGRATAQGVEVAGLGLLRGESALRGDAALAVRPERVALLGAAPGDGRNAVPGRVAQIAYHGAEVSVHVHVCGGRYTVMARLPAGAADGAHLRPGAEVVCAWDVAHSRVLPQE